LNRQKTSISRPVKGGPLSKRQSEINDIFRYFDLMTSILRSQAVTRNDRKQRKRNPAFDLVGVESNPGPPFRRSNPNDLVGIELNPGPNPGLVGFPSATERHNHNLGRSIGSAFSLLARYGPDAIKAGRTLARTYNQFVSSTGGTPRLVGIETNPGPKSKSKQTGYAKTSRRAAGKAKPRQPRINMSGTGKVISAPASIGFTSINNGMDFKISGNPAPSDYSVDRGIRIAGSCLFAPQVATGGTLPGALNGGFTTLNLTPKLIDSRLASFEQCFEYYAIRMLRFTYVTQVPSSTQGALFAAINSDYSSNAANTLNPSVIMQFNPSMMVPIWGTNSMVYKHTGSKVWECYASTESNDSRIQVAIHAILAGGTISTQYGYFTVDFVVDLYEPTPVLPSIN
jgi:hypothetical protein